MKDERGKRKDERGKRKEERGERYLINKTGVTPTSCHSRT
jgi:hypothetical protein